ncbi:hypothetical protein H632_c133p1 [Helicosporidium sp. ATCC 50920]|nr:hypothetical protein H632_c133p1 [Helicosporidium sp. ATCC 50920]|eukprot:KDD76704.1 hypothetical protein H632_c133p1 [Helicosporidium sp. ATCC 50920]
MASPSQDSMFSLAHVMRSTGDAIASRVREALDAQPHRRALVSMEAHRLGPRRPRPYCTGQALGFDFFVASTVLGSAATWYVQGLSCYVAMGATALTSAVHAFPGGWRLQSTGISARALVEGSRAGALAASSGPLAAVRGLLLASRRTVTSSLVHDSLPHLCLTLTSLATEGASMERSLGPWRLAALSAGLAALSTLYFVGLTWASHKIGFPPALAAEYPKTFVLGLSPVLLGLKVVSGYIHPPPPGPTTFGSIEDASGESQFGCWVTLAMLHSLVPDASMAASFAGVAAGLSAVYAWAGCERLDEYLRCGGWRPRGRGVLARALRAYERLDAGLPVSLRRHRCGWWDLGGHALCAAAAGLFMRWYVVKRSHL